MMTIFFLEYLHFSQSAFQGSTAKENGSCQIKQDRLGERHVTTENLCIWQECMKKRKIIAIASICVVEVGLKFIMASSPCKQYKPILADM